MGLMLLGLFVFLPSRAQLRLNFDKNSPMLKLGMAERVITDRYVDSVSESQLVEDAIRGMLEKLDPHSSYSTAREAKAMNEPLLGDFEGIGVQFNMLEDTLVVIQPVHNGPSEKVGILAGDRIVSVNDTAIAGVKMAQTDIMRRLRGRKGTRVRLGIVRRGVAGVTEYTVVRAKIPLHTVDASYMIRPRVGYIRLGSFGMTTYKEMMAAVDSLRGQGMKSLVIDLQENGGGFLQAATQVTNEFLRRDAMIVYTQGRAQKRQEFKADGHGRLQDERVIVLVNEYTASAAEILSGALQDHDRALVVGRRTFGKGLVQAPIPFPDGSMMRLTVAHYYTPSGRCIQKPYVKGAREDYALDIEHRLKHGELTNRDSIHFADSLKYYTLKRHRVVYGGGGIMPDEFVPLDTMKFTRLHRALVARNIILSTALNYIDSHRRELHGKYASFEVFDKTYDVPAFLLDSILAEGERQGVKPADEAECTRTLTYLRYQLKAFVARDLWGMNGYFRIWNEHNDIVRRALELL